MINYRYLCLKKEKSVPVSCLGQNKNNVGWGQKDGRPWIRWASKIKMTDDGIE